MTCSSGMISLGDTAHCTSCLAGTFSDSRTGSTSCKKCDDMMWSTEKASECHICITEGLTCDAANGGALSWSVYYILF